MRNNKDSEKNIATSTSSFSEEYIDTHPNKFEDHQPVPEVTKSRNLFASMPGSASRSVASSRSSTLIAILLFAFIISLFSKR